MRGIFTLSVIAVSLLFAFGTVSAQELSANIQRRVNAATLDLDKAEDLIRRDRAELSTKHVKGAKKEYDNIFSYYSGSFDPNHPTLVALKRRIAELTTRGEQGQAASKEPAPAKSAGQSKELSANIRRRMDAIERQLVWVDQAIAKGGDASGPLGAARREWDNILNYYRGTFDPNHAELIALKTRIDEAEKAMNAGVAATARATPVESRMSIEGMPGEMGSHLKQVGGSLHTLENRLVTAYKGSNAPSYYPGVKSDLEIAENQFAQFNGRYAGKYDPGHEAYVRVTRRLEKARANVDKLRREGEAATAAADKAGQTKLTAAVKAIHGRFKQQAVSSKRHAENIGRFIWSKKGIGFKIQDQAVLSDTFTLSDPIYGRLYTPHSLGNTPVYQEGGNEPKPNNRFGYIYRLYIDGENVPVSFGVFGSGEYNETQAKGWTSWQYGPHPVPPDEGFKFEADAWRVATKDLAPGRHSVRFEFWGVDASYRTREPMAAGGFTLVVGAGERVAATGKFPGDSYGGGDLKRIRAQMKKALVGQVAKSADQILDVSVIGDWAHGAYTDSKVRYRKITGTVLWADTDGDKVCRYSSYVFISDESSGGGWSPVRYRAFRTGASHEGDVECPPG